MDATSSLHAAWLHTLDEYVIDTSMSQFILSLMRPVFRRTDLRGLLLQKGHRDHVASNIAAFISEESPS
jgi:hypothetical protein